ncbi:sensor histidine kinase [Mucilaginibacter rubeus]|uniref:histidine kinase n=1 Tax=Mucilaginibacter rubeus TaxID=2027860 RepID=A0AAE6JBP4_9SPHI|nr:MULTISPECIES: sensor histidine kinase [Mucilaginibacter]QEM02697.1 sensor histidine kinase [Mucilaginibacter rubeus]QEM15316.1 sensor histidine kinase [Mucilaginibacter gossypii]QTE41955.1 sensor histidine kinase [Mucilaginibacter rubeus]QTE48557.1 sensor histidine kinase [Mucilaginibacter rubeus]QTE59943.1 sensor histidine kinase [Mucilaginibacter rubeus]
MTIPNARFVKATNASKEYITNNISSCLAIGVLQSKWLIGITVLLLLIGGCVLLLERISIRKNKDVKGQQIKTLELNIALLKGDINKLSTEKEWLVAEMHHRVKNNLQVLSSLINSQLSFTDDKTGREVLFYSKHRLYALSLVHQKLFQQATGAAIEMSCCIKEVVDYLIDEFECAERITFDLNLVPITIDPDTAIPFALIINELATNSLKYAFPNEAGGKITITLLHLQVGTYRLMFADNGIGLPEGFDFLSAKSLGKTLIMGLSRQIRGAVTVNTVSGFEVIIDFKTKTDQQAHFVFC